MVEDNDIINMVDEDYLLDAVRQRLNSLHLQVWFTGQKGLNSRIQRLNSMRQRLNVVSISSNILSLKLNATPKGDCLIMEQLLHQRRNKNKMVMTASFKMVILIIFLVLQHLPFLQSLIIISHNCMHILGPSKRIFRGICQRTTKPSKMTFGVQCDGCRMIPIECCCYASKL